MQLRTRIHLIVAPEHVLIARVVPNGLNQERGEVFYQQLLSRLNAMPEVVSASIGWNPTYAIGRNFFSLPGHEDASVEAGATAVAPRFVQTLGKQMAAQAARYCNRSCQVADCGLVVCSRFVVQGSSSENVIVPILRNGSHRAEQAECQKRCQHILNEPCDPQKPSGTKRNATARGRAAGSRLGSFEVVPQIEE
jgi:hypothetical protein